MGQEDNNNQSSQQPQQQPQYYGQQPYGYQPQQYQYQPQYQPQYQQPEQYQQQYPPPQQQQPYQMPLPPQQQPQYHHDRESLINQQIPPNQPPPPDQIGMYGPEESYEKFPTPQYRDLPFGIAFLVHLALLLIITISAYSKTPLSYYNSHSYIDSSGEIMGLIFVVLPLTIIFCCIFLYAWMKLAKNHGEGLIKATFITAIFLDFAYMVYFFATGLLGLGIVFLIGGIFCLIFFIAFRGRIPFTATLLNTAVGIIEDFPSSLRMGYFSMVLNFFWYIFWASTLIRVNRVYEGGVQTCINIYLVFSLYWTFQVIKNIVHTTISGLFATWYFQSGADGQGMPSNPTLNSFRRATTTSFGSICLGSLIIAVIQTLRYLSNLMMNNKNVFVRIIGFILNFILGLMEAILSFFNIYVFTHVAIYGESYISSAKRTADLFAHRLGTTIINDNFIGTTISISAFAAALLLSILGALIGIGFGNGAPFYGGLLTFVIGLLIIITSLEVVYSGVVSLFVCYVLNPSVLYHTKPALYRIYSETYSLR